MAEEKDIVAILLAVYASNNLKAKKMKRKNRSVWVKPYLAQRSTMSAYQLVNELRLTDEEEYRCYLRMDTSTFMVSGIRLTRKHTFVYKRYYLLFKANIPR